MPSIEKLFYTYNDFDKAMKILNNKIRNISFDYIYAPPRGGLPLGVHMSHMINKPLLLSIDEAKKHIGGKIYNILIIDDISDTGETLKHTMCLLKELTLGKIKSATWHMKPRTKQIPDIYVEVVPNDVWVVYPWENKLDNPDKDYMYE